MSKEPSLSNQTIKSLEKQVKRLGKELALAQDRQVYYENTAEQTQNLLNTRITEIESARSELSARARELVQSQERFHSLANAAFEAILIHDKDIILDCNDNALALYGYSREQLLKMKLLQLVHPKSIDKVTQSLADSSSDDSLQAKHLRKDGTKVPVEMHSKAILMNNQISHVTAVRDITERKKMEDELKRLARTDELTGLHNRRYFMELSGIELTRALRYDQPVSVLMLDIDHFKSINDNYGHETGDRALNAFSCACLSATRTTDIFGRLGGEEFAFLMPETSANAAQEVAERLRETIELVKVATPDGNTLNMTVSIGLTELLDDDRSMDNVLNRADQAMYQAKTSGRNKVVRI
mgnify:CR=1 FL=1